MNKYRLALAFMLGFGLAYAWQHKPPTPPCLIPASAPESGLRDILFWKPWAPWRGA